MSAKSLILLTTALLSIPLAANAGMMGQATTISGSVSVPTQSASYGPTSDNHGATLSDSRVVESIAPRFYSPGFGPRAIPVTINQAVSTISASSDGVFGLGVNGNQQYSANAHVNNNFLYQNDTSETMEYTLRLFLTAGQLASSLTYDNSASAGYSMNLSRDGINIYNSAVTIHSDGSYQQTGGQMDNVSITDSANGAYGPATQTYSWTDTWIEISLGSLTAGSSMFINYDFLIDAVGDFSGNTTYCPTNGVTSHCSSGTRVGDPFDITGSGGGQPWIFVGSPTPDPSAVPEPTSILLASLGVMAMAAARRKQKKAAE